MITDSKYYVTLSYINISTDSKYYEQYNINRQCIMLLSYINTYDNRQ